MDSSYFPALCYEPWSAASSQTILFIHFYRTMAILQSSLKADSKQLYGDTKNHEKLK